MGALFSLAKYFSDPPRARVSHLRDHAYLVQETVFLDFAEGVLREVFDDTDLAGVLVVGEGSGAEGGELLEERLRRRGGGGRRMEDDGGDDSLAPDAVGGADDGYVLDARVAAEDV